MWTNKQVLDKFYEYSDKNDRFFMLLYVRCTVQIKLARLSRLSGSLVFSIEQECHLSLQSKNCVDISKHHQLLYGIWYLFTWNSETIPLQKFSRSLSSLVL